MARKKMEPIETLGDKDSLTVQKSRPLFALWQSELTLAEFKILDTYLGRINSHDEESRTVKFEKGELEKLLGIKQLKPEVLDERLKHLMTTVRIPDENNRRGFARIALFERAYAEQDDYGVWEAELTCTPSAKKYIFNVDEIGYLQYKLRCVINMKSRYTYIMFLYLWDNKFRGTWEIPVDELKALLCCDGEDTYKEFKRFNDLILKKVQKEIHEVTDIRYEYETVKRGRSVVAVRFTYISNNGLDEVDANQITIEQYLDETGHEMWEDALKDFEFSTEQLDELREVLHVIPQNVLPEPPVSELWGDVDAMRYHYMKIKAAEIKRRNETKPIKNKFSYLLKILKQDAKQK